ncbi:glycoside hydrolase family 16 protein [Flavobacterium rhizosphaerae]|uniref:Glycoside hydrolase family 16 protein n=1 Tax=Flavobacterium rhizosphaerae TaxID=3163298 RepID=A0ABW8YU94_9FLAO
MKEILKHVGKLLVLLILVSSCQDDDNTFGKIIAPTNLELGYEIIGQSADNPNGDGSGNAILTAHADNAITYKFIFEDETSVSDASGKITKRFTTPGIHTYTITVVAYGKGGVSTSGTIVVEDILSTFNDPATTELLTGNSSKVWYVARDETAHLGVGPNDPNLPDTNYWWSWWFAQPNEKGDSETENCIYTNKLTFTKQGNLIKYTLENDATFFNKAYLSLVGESGPDACAPFDVSGVKNVTLEPAESVVAEEFTTGTQMKFSDGGFMGYYIGTSVYEILELTENRMVVRAVQGNDPATAWYQIFTTQDPDGPVDPVFTTLAWSDEFDYTGAPDTAKWNMETGGGGWGNNEVQNYQATGNAVVSNNTLKITARKESDGTITSARMTTHNHWDFTYGKVEFRAKLPTVGGSWPALWMLGSNYLTNTWPGCGEVDVMEHVGNDLNTIHGTLHYPENSGGNGNTGTTTVDDVAQWHTYSAVWTADFIKFYVDDTLYKTFNNSPNVPFNHDFFIIMNVAMGGTFGGNIDAGFTEATMEIDYVRVYQ